MTKARKPAPGPMALTYRQLPIQRRVGGGTQYVP